MSLFTQVMKWILWKYECGHRWLLLRWWKLEVILRLNELAKPSFTADQ